MTLSRLMWNSSSEPATSSYVLMRILVRLLASSSTSSLDAPAEDAFLFFAIMILCWLLCGKTYQRLLVLD
jgi:hypothetical protein